MSEPNCRAKWSNGRQWRDSKKEVDLFSRSAISGRQYIHTMPHALMQRNQKTYGLRVGMGLQDQINDSIVKYQANIELAP
jgi:hypothetical protein